jgi:hypothetical protein
VIKDRTVEEQINESSNPPSNHTKRETENSEVMLQVKSLESNTPPAQQHSTTMNPQLDHIISLDHIVKTSIELDEMAMKKIELLLALGSRRLAQDFKELLEEAFRAVDQNANLLRILRHKMGTSKDE